jgi:Na+-transporting NADH:ubiquinone oxidoreductase subunit A
MNSFKITKGHNLKLSGIPSENLIDVKSPSSIFFHPSSIKNIKTKLLVKEGDSVKVGSPLFCDKKNEKVLFVSSCSGTIKKIHFGQRRIVEVIEIENDEKNTVFDSLDRGVSKESFLKSGLWPYLRQKPYSKIPHYSIEPKSIYISAMPTEPFALNYESLMKDSIKSVQLGVDVLKKIFDCEINFTSSNESIFSNLSNVNHYSFNNLHPAGNIGVQIHHIDPIKNGDDIRFYLTLQDLVRIGEFFNMEDYPNLRYISIGGNGIDNQAIYKVLIGTSIQDIIDSDLSNDIQIISGDVLNGKITVKDKSLNFHDEVLSVIKNDNKRQFLGWLMPGFKKYSLTKAFFSRLLNNKGSELSTNKNGSIRTIVPMGNWDRVMPMNIMSEYLVKSILANDIDMMEKLGIYECSPEDFSLCTFICQSKVEVSKIIEDGLDIMESEA